MIMNPRHGFVHESFFLWSSVIMKLVADMRSFIPSTTFHVACLKNHKNVVGTYDLCQGTVDFTPAHNNLCIGTTSTWFHRRYITAFYVLFRNPACPLKLFKLNLCLYYIMFVFKINYSSYIYSYIQNQSYLQKLYV